MRLLIGGSPCTHWSIAQTKNRETEPCGIGWELFENYLIALEKFRPDYFLYENNKSMSRAIREEITKRFGFEPICINSSLVSAQNRQRLYWCGKRNQDGTYIHVEIEQPEDRHVYMSHIVDFDVQDTDLIEFVKFNGRACTRFENKPVRVGTIGSGGQGERVYSLTGKSVTVSACGGGRGAKGGLYLIDGRVRKLSTIELSRLQTIPDSYSFECISDARAKKCIGNGWTVDVIAYIMSHFEGIATEPLDVLSMYDGMACGHIALDKLGATIARYRATEIDKYAIKTACHNFPDIEQLGDAFGVRTENWFS